MHVPTLISILAVAFPLASAAPLGTQNSPLPSTCPLQLNHTVSTMISNALEDTRSGWVPVDENGQYLEPGTLVSASVIDLRFLGGEPDQGPFWNVVPLEQPLASNEPVPHLVQLASDTTRCLSGAGTGGNAGQVDFVSCETDAAKWSIICETCQLGGGNVCEFAAWPRTGDGDKCATSDYDQYGPIQLTACDPFFEPSLWKQKFSLGQLAFE